MGPPKEEFKSGLRSKVPLPFRVMSEFSGMTICSVNKMVLSMISSTGTPSAAAATCIFKSSIVEICNELDVEKEVSSFSSCENKDVCSVSALSTDE